MNCTASPRVSEQFGDQTTEYASEGTAAHELAARWLEAGHEPQETVYLDDNDRHAIKTYVDYVQALVVDGAELMVEQAIQLDAHDDMWGTADAVVAVPDAKHVYVIDYKHGVGIPVSAVNNPQLMYYALGVLKRLHNRMDVETVTLVIVQPRSLRRGLPISEWEISVDELRDFERLLRQAGEEADQGGEFNPGPWCRFCRASGQCEAQFNHVLDLIGASFTPDGELILSDLELFDSERTATALLNSQQITGFLNKLKERAIEQALAGHPPKGMKLVRGRSRRTWANEEDAVRFLTEELGLEDVTEEKVRSPAQVEKLIPRQDRAVISEYVQVDYGNPQLVPLDDPKPAVAPDIDTDLEGI